MLDGIYRKLKVDENEHALGSCCFIFKKLFKKTIFLSFVIFNFLNLIFLKKNYKNLKKSNLLKFFLII